MQVPKVNKGSEESATSGARTSRASSISTAPSVMASTEKKIPATPPRVPAASTAQASSAVTSANINSTTVGVAPPAATYVRASIDSSAAAGGTHQGIGRSERGSKSPETSSLRRLNNVTSPAGSTSINLGNSSSANRPTPPAVSVAVASNQSTAAPRDRQTPPSAPSMSEHSSGANSGADNNKSAAVAASLDRSVARQYEPSAILKASLPPSTVRSSSDRAPAAMSSLPPPQQLEVSFDRSVDAVHRAVADSGRGSGEPSRHSRSAHDLHKSHHHQHPDLNESNDKTAPSSASAVSSHKGSAHKAHRASADIGHHTSSAQETRGVGASETQEEDFSEQPFAGLRHALKPVTAKDLEESLQLLRYDIHREVQDVIREQIRQFSIAKVNL